MKNLGSRAWVGAGAAGVALLGYLVGRVHADGIPAATPLVYAGVLEDSGRPVEGNHAVTLRLWSAATGGSLTCPEASSTAAFAAGHFRQALDPGCTAAVQRSPDLWVEVLVDAASYGRSKLAAVPYAVEASRAAGASGALETRLTGIEAAARRRQVESASGPVSVGFTNFTTAWALIPGAPTLTFVARSSGRYQLRTMLTMSCQARARIAPVVGAPSIDWQPFATVNFTGNSPCLQSTVPVELWVTLTAGTSYTFGIEYRADSSRGGIGAPGDTGVALTALQLE